MKLTGKIEQPDDINAHFQELSDYQTPVRIYREDGQYSSKGRFLFDTDGDGLLRCRPAIPIECAPDRPVSFRYNLEEKVFAFKIFPLGVEGRILSFELPKSVPLFERRGNFRVQPSREAPVIVRPSFPGHPELLMNVADFSSNGFSFHFPRGREFFSPGTEFSARIHLPGNSRISGQAVVKNLSPFFGVTRVGCEFSGLCDADRQQISSYCMRRQMETKSVPVSFPNGKGARICIIDSTKGREDYEALTRLFDVEIVPHLNALKYLYSTPPKLIVLMVDHAGAKLISQALGRDQRFKELPLVLVGNNLKPKERAAGVVTIGTPYKQPLLVKSVSELLYQAGLSRKAEADFYRCFLGNGKSIAMVDPLGRLKAVRFRILEDLEFAVRWIKTPDAVIPQVEAAAPALIVMNSDTGAMDPAALSRLINFNKNLKAIPKIRLISGAPPPESYLFENAGIHFLEESFSEEELLRGVNRALYGDRYETGASSAENDDRGQVG